MEKTTPLATSSSQVEHVFITGASGCVGHYLLDACLAVEHLHIHVLVRHPERLAMFSDRMDRITIHQGDFRDIARFEPIVKTMHYIIHTLTEWWGYEQTQDVNVNKTRDFFMMIDPAICKHIIYFSTASLLGKNSVVVKEARDYGSDYIKSKYDAHHMIKTLPFSQRITTLFPTMVFGGDTRYPQSHITSGVHASVHYLKYLRFLSVDGAFHFIHSADIAQMAVYLMQHPLKNRRAVPLGQPSLTLRTVIAFMTRAFGLRRWFQIHVPNRFILFLAKCFRITIGPWERYCIEHSHMVFDCLCPEDLGLTSRFKTLPDIIHNIQSFK